MADIKKISQMLVIAGATSASLYLTAQRLRATGASLEPVDFIVEPVAPRTGPAAASGANANANANTNANTNTNRTALERDATLALPTRSRMAPESNGNAFSNLSWLPPPPQAVAVPAPPKPPPPTAPPLPFTFVGLMEKGAARPQAFLSRGDALLVVAAGDTIDNNTYRIETLSAQKIVITYLPMNIQQSLNILGTTP